MCVIEQKVFGFGSYAAFRLASTHLKLRRNWYACEAKLVLLPVTVEFQQHQLSLV